MILATFLMLFWYSRFLSCWAISSQPGSRDRGRGVPAERGALFALQRCAAEHSAGGADHVWTDGALQRNHSHQGDGHQHLPHRCSGARRRRLSATRLFFSDQFYLPYANKRQDALRNLIKGKPAQTYLSPDRKWIFGQHIDIYYYQFFDSDRDQFGNISVFQFDPAAFPSRTGFTPIARIGPTSEALGLRARMGAEPARLRYSEGYRSFDVSTFPAFSEPPTYFKKEVKQYSEMNYEELRRYIHDLQQSGFDVVRLRVQLQRNSLTP